MHPYFPDWGDKLTYSDCLIHQHAISWTTKENAISYKTYNFSLRGKKYLLFDTVLLEKLTFLLTLLAANIYVILTNSSK